MANLSALLDKEASAEIEAILSEAKERASEIVAKAKEEAASIASTRERSAASQAEATLVRAKSAAQLESASLKLKAQHEAVQGVMEAVKKKISGLKGKAYEDTFGKLFKEAAEGVSGKVTEVVVNPSDKALAEKLASGAKVVTSKDISKGLRVRGEGSTVSVENSLLARLDALKDELASDVSSVLFGKEA